MQDWPKFLYDAYKNNIRNLCSYLHSTDSPLNPIQRRQLAELIDRKIYIKDGRGRKPGKIPLEPELAEEFERSLRPRSEPLVDERSQRKDDEASNKPVFQYRRSRGDPSSRVAMYNKWPYALFEAYDGKTKDLRDYLCDYDLFLYKSQRRELADLIHSRIRREARLGRPPGPVRSPGRLLGKIMSDDVVARAKHIRASVRKKNGGRVARGGIADILSDALVSFVDDGYEHPRDFEYDTRVVQAALRRGNRST